MDSVMGILYSDELETQISEQYYNTIWEGSVFRHLTLENSNVSGLIIEDDDVPPIVQNVRHQPLYPIYGDEITDQD